MFRRHANHDAMHGRPISHIPSQPYTMKGAGFREFLSTFSAPGTRSWNPTAAEASGVEPPRTGATEDQPSEAFVSRTLYLTRLNHEATEETLRSICAPIGEVRRYNIDPSRQCAYVEFLDIRSAEKARNILRWQTIGGRQVEVQYCRPNARATAKESNTGTLYVRPVTSERNFQDPNTAEEYRKLFEMYGEVKKVNSNRKREAEKFVEFYDLRSAEQALQNLNGYNFNGVILEVQFANQSSKTLNRETAAKTEKDRRPK
eukprot:GHVO01049953.1.p1 GENE.GHVO01049953.1~~GHVO01049953.1.p1  ORF type:complete len:259 (-),score=48.37 GHVO01049953.1:72-848(-)